MIAMIAAMLGISFLAPPLDEGTEAAPTAIPRPDIRVELGRRLLEFERRLDAHRPEESELRQLDAAFDRATLSFFSGQASHALTELDALIERLPPLDEPAPDQLATWRDLDRERLDQEREALEARLARALVKMPDLVDIASIAFARLSKLRSDDAADTLRLVEPFDRFREEVASEVAAICRGVDPYRGRSGDSWQAITKRTVWRADDLPNNLIPYRIVIPSQRRPDERFPLVIAFHGAGGDENMFPFAYGAGELARLAEAKRFVLMSPLTYPFLWRTEYFSKLTTRAEHLAPIDLRRVYLLGHSLGCGVTETITSRHHESIAAIALFAGNTLQSIRKRPTIAFFGKNDPLLAARFLGSLANRADQDGLSLRVIEDRGHTLFVGERLEEAVDFLLTHSLPETAGK